MSDSSNINSGLCVFGKIEGFEIFSSTGLFKNLDKHSQKSLIDAIQLQLEDIKIHENHRIFSFSKGVINNDFYVFFIIYDFSKDALGRNGYYASCLASKHYYLDIASAMDSLDIANKRMSKFLDNKGRIEASISTDIKLDDLTFNLDYNSPINKDINFTIDTKYAFVLIENKDINYVNLFFELSKINQSKYNRVFNSSYTDLNLLNKKKFDVISIDDFLSLSHLPSNDAVNPLTITISKPSDSLAPIHEDNHNLYVINALKELAKLLRINFSSKKNLDITLIKNNTKTTETKKINELITEYINTFSYFQTKLFEQNNLLKEQINKSLKLEENIKSLQTENTRLLSELRSYEKNYENLQKIISDSNLEIQNLALMLKPESKKKKKT